MRLCIISVVFTIVAATSVLDSVAQAETHFGQESQVNYADSTGWETNQDMAVDSNGNLYVVWEAKSLTGSNRWLSFWRSSDGGLNWQQIGSLYDPDADLLHPSIAVGEGLMNRLVVAYVVDDGSSHTYIEVAYAPLGTGNFVIATPPDIGPFSSVGAPEIWTDASRMNIWRAYVTCTEYNPKDMYHSLVTWRSDNYASAWQAKKKVLSGYIYTEWSTPHAAFGTPSKISYIICCREDSNRIEMVYTADHGANYYGPIIVADTMSLPWTAVNPQIAVARDYHSLVVCFLERVGGYDELIYVQSKDGGGGWSSKDGVTGWGSYSRFDPELTADVFGGHGFHVAYTRQSKVYHNYIEPDLPGKWSDPSLVCGTGFASHADTKKGIACHPETNAAFVCWCDTRDGSFDTDTFFNYSGSLVVGSNTISASIGGYSFLFLSAGQENAGRKYLILGGVTGIKPGTQLPGAKATLPINWDPFTDLVLSLFNTYAFTDFYGTLDAKGEAAGFLNAPPLNPAYVGVKMYFAYCLNNPFDFASNAVAIEIVP